MSNISIDKLQLEVEGSSDKAEKSLDKLISKLDKLTSTINKCTGMTRIAKQIDKITTAINNASGIEKIERLCSSLEKFQNIKAPNVTKAVNAINKLATASTAIGSLSGLDQLKSNISAITEACKPMENMGKNTLTPFLNSLKKLPEITNSLDTKTLETFAERIKQITASITPLTNAVAKSQTGLSALNNIIRATTASNGNLAASNATAVRSFTSLGGILSSVKIKAAAFLVIANKLGSVLSDCLDSSNAYVENLNLFSVSMGDAAQSALDYAEKVNKLLGIDVSDWIRNQGVFKQITSGFGVITEKANLMSQNLTQIGYDISSFFNISVEDAMQKVQSGISGELEPLRRLGYALDAATLQQIAYNNGITQNINTMTQAQKSQLRYVAILQQSTNVMGDMARTIVTPANSMRILNQQIEQMKRALGNVVSVIAMKVIPYVQVAVRLLTDLGNWLAKKLGFELPEIDYTGVSNGISSITDSADEATDAIKETEKQLNWLAGFDEITKVPSQNDSNDNSSDTAGNNFDLGIDLPEYDFLKDLNNQTDKLYKKVKSQLKEIYKWWHKHKDIIKVIAGLLAGIWVVDKISNFIGWIKKVKSGFDSLKVIKNCTGWLGKLKSIGVGALSGIASGLASCDLFEKLGSGTLDWKDALSDTLIILGSIGAAFAIGGPLAGGIAIVGALAGAFVGLYKAGRDARMEISGLSDNGGTKISDIAEAFKDQCDNVIAAKDAVSKYKDEIANNQDSIDEAVGKLRDFGDRLSGLGGKLTDSDKEAIKSDFEAIATAVKNNIGAETQGVIDNFKSAMENLPTSLKQSCQESINELNALQSQLSGNVDKAKSYIDDYYDTIWNGGTPTEEQKAQFDKATEYFLKKSAENSSAFSEYKKTFEEIDLSKIDFQDFDTFKESVGQLNQSANDAISAITTAKQDSLDYIESLYQESIDQYDAGFITDAQLKIAEETFSKAKENINKSADVETQAIKDNLGKILGQAQTQLNNTIDFQAQYDALQETQNVCGDYLQWSDDEWALFNQNYAIRIKDQKKNFGDQQKVITDATKELGINLKDYVDTAKNSLVDLNHADIGGWGKQIAAKKGAKTGDWTDYGTMIANQISDGIDIGADGTIESVKGMTDNMLKEFTKGGENCIAGFTTGLNKKEKDALAATTNFGVNGINALYKTYDMHSPSKKTHQIGVFFVQGFINGVKSLTDFATSYAGKFAKETVTSFDANSTTTSIGIKFIDRFISGISIRKSALINEVVDIFNTILSKADDFHVQFLNSFNDVAPMLQVATNGILAAMGQAISIPQISYTAPGYRVKGYATGGYPTTGQLFMARENGIPEMVGSIGGKNAVANNGQIEQALFKAVYAAMKESNKESSAKQSVIRIEGNKDKLVKVCIDGINDKTKQNGKSPLI